MKDEIHLCYFGADSEEMREIAKEIGVDFRTRNGTEKVILHIVKNNDRISYFTITDSQRVACAFTRLRDEGKIKVEPLEFPWNSCELIKE